MSRTQTITADSQTAPLPVLTDGGTIVCIATGPSLTLEDVNYCRERAHVVALNDAWRLAPWADVLYSSDARWYPFHHWVPGYHGIKVSLDVKHDGVITMKCTGHNGIEWNRHGLRSQKNTGGAAINLAVHLGAKRIVLLGYDMGADEKKPKHHFFGQHPQGLRTSSPANFMYFRSLMQSMVDPLKSRHITVVNASRRTNLTCFPRQSLEQALP